VDIHLDPLVKEAIRVTNDKLLNDMGADNAKFRADHRVTGPNKNRRTLTLSDEMRDPTARAEAALKALREAKEAPARMRAADELERALHEIRRQLDRNEQRN
jgi:hypothetical protein